MAGSHGHPWLPHLQAAGVELVEQPLACGQDDGLLGIKPPIPLAADESCTDRASLAHLVGRYQFVNIKLDKCGGLTEGLALATEARRLGLGLMVGNMCGTSLAMTPPSCWPSSAATWTWTVTLLQTEDRAHGLEYRGGEIQVPCSALWG